MSAEQIPVGRSTVGRWRGERLREVREAKDWSQSDLSERIGAHFTSISDWERSKYPPGARHLSSICLVFQKPIGFFFEVDEDDGEVAIVQAAAELSSQGNYALAADLLAGLARFRDAGVRPRPSYRGVPA